MLDEKIPASKARPVEYALQAFSGEWLPQPLAAAPRSERGVRRQSKGGDCHASGCSSGGDHLSVATNEVEGHDERCFRHVDRLTQHENIYAEECCEVRRDKDVTPNNSSTGQANGKHEGAKP